MNTKTPHLERRFEKHLQATASALPQLEQEISHIGGFMHKELQGRLHNVEVMEHALRRNYTEVFHSPEKRPAAKRVRRLRRLCRCIEKESENLRREVGFLSMGSASSIIALVEGSSTLLNRAYHLLRKSVPHGLRCPGFAH